jgi:hypothetical protein
MPNINQPASAQLQQVVAPASPTPVAIAAPTQPTVTPVVAPTAPTITPVVAPTAPTLTQGVAVTAPTIAPASSASTSPVVSSATSLPTAIAAPAVTPGTTAALIATTPQASATNAKMAAAGSAVQSVGTLPGAQVTNAQLQPITITTMQTQSGLVNVVQIGPGNTFSLNMSPIAIRRGQCDSEHARQSGDPADDLDTGEREQLEPPTRQHLQCRTPAAVVRRGALIVSISFASDVPWDGLTEAVSRRASRRLGPGARTPEKVYCVGPILGQCRRSRELRIALAAVVGDAPCSSHACRETADLARVANVRMSA